MVDNFNTLEELEEVLGPEATLPLDVQSISWDKYQVSALRYCSTPFYEISKSLTASYTVLLQVNHFVVLVLQEYLELPGVLDCQLISKGASNEDLQQHPARMSRPGA